MEFGVFDHLDQRPGAALETIYEERLRLIAGYEAAGITTLLCRFAFGDLSLEESLNSINLFADEVMPALEDIVPESQTGAAS